KRQGLSLRAIASELNRSPSTLSRELQRRTVEGRPYDAEAAGLAARSARLLCRPRRKLVEGTDLHEVVVDMLRNKWSSQQISGTLKTMFPQWRLILSGFAYTLFERLRVHLKNTPFERMSAGTLRLKLIKVGAVIIRNTRRIRVLMSDRYPYQKDLSALVQRLVPT
ncbi:MAG: transposase, partial [Marinobacter sp.]|nr:transposase [Marinobacter sp.]